MTSGLRGASLVVALFSTVAALAAEPDPLPERLAIEHVTVLSMNNEGAVLPDMTVLVHEGRIVSVGPSSGTRAPRGAKRIDGRGKWLIPGLTDMHVHIGNVRMLRLYLKVALTIATASSYLPPEIERRRYFGQDWADVQRESTTYGVLTKARIGTDWALPVGVFESVYNLERGFAELFVGTTPDGMTRELVIADPQQRYASTSGESD